MAPSQFETIKGRLPFSAIERETGITIIIPVKNMQFSPLRDNCKKSEFGQLGKCQSDNLSAEHAAAGPQLEEESNVICTLECAARTLYAQNLGG